MSRFSVYLKELIEKRGEPIARIAKNTGLERTSIHKALKDERLLPYTAVRRLSQYLQLTLPQSRELSLYYEMLLQGEDIYRTQEAICGLLSELSQLHFSSRSPARDFSEISVFPSSPCLIPGRPQIEAALRSIIFHETSKESSCISLYIPAACSVISDLFQLWRSGRDFTVRQMVPFLPDRTGEDNRQANLHTLQRLLPLSLVSGGRHFAHYYFENSGAFADIDPLPFFIITPRCLIRLDSKLSIARIETDPQLIELYERRFSQVLNECQPLNSYSNDIKHVLSSYMQGTDEDSYYTLMTQPCLGHYYTRDRIAKHFRPDVPNREMLIELSDKRFERLRRLTGNYYTIFSEQGLRQFAKDGVAIDLPPELIMPVNMATRIEILRSFRDDIACGNVKGCIADTEKLPIPPYLTLTCDPKFGLHIYAVQGFIGGAYSCNLHIEESGIGESFCSFIRSLPDSKYVYSMEKTLSVLDELISDLESSKEGV